ncbi:MAG: hypothetical protein PXX77_04030 [Gallionella sp.]|nr:hypothetical protein [Gallionella sp.]
MGKDCLDLDYLIRAYLRFKEWMDYDIERSAYCAMEIIVMQKLFGTAYITVPANLATASYEELLDAMEERQNVLNDLTYSIDMSAGIDEIHRLLNEVNKTTFKSTVHYFVTLHEAITQVAASATYDPDSDKTEPVIDTEPFEDHFEEADEVLFEEIKAFIIRHYPKIESLSFPIETRHVMGLPRHAPNPVPDVFQ